MNNNIHRFYEEHETKRLHNQIASFFDNFQIGTLLGQSGIRHRLSKQSYWPLLSNFFNGVVVSR
jgi:hypothetical protein